MRRLLALIVSIAICIPIAVNSKSKELITAATWGQAVQLKKLLSEGGSIYTRDDKGRSLLMIAILYKRYHVVKLLLDSGSSVDVKDNDDKNVIHYMASHYGAPAVATAKMILDKGSSIINAKDKDDNNALHLAAMYNNTAMIKLLLSYNPNINSHNKQDKTPLVVAIEKNFYYPAEALITAGANYSSKDNSGKSAIHYAAQMPSPLIFNLLLKKGLSDSQKNEALFYAAEKKNISLVQSLIKAGADINRKDGDGKTLLHHAAGINGYLGMNLVNELIKGGSSVNAKDSNGSTPIGTAIKAGNYPAITLFLQHNLDINGTEKGVPYALYAYENFQIGIANLLIAKGAAINSKDNNNRTLLHLAAERGDINMLNQLLAKDAEINGQDGEGRTPLMLAVQKNKAYPAKLIYDKNADLSKRDRYGRNVFHYLADQWSPYVLDIMVKKGKQPEVNARDNAEKTPLSIAFKSGKHAIAQLLLKLGADPNLKDEQGQSLLFLALNLSNYNLVKMLVDNGMDINKPIDNNEYPLMLAISKSNQSLVQLFLDKGASITIKSNDETPASLAVEKNNASILKLILDKGANANDKTAKNVPLLLRAYEKYNIFSFNHLLKAKADPNIDDGSGRPLVINACMAYDRRFFLKSLIEHNANLNIRDSKMNTPLIAATTSNQYTAVLYLLSDKTNKPDIDAKNSKGETTLFLAADKSNLLILDLLLKNGANATTITKQNGDTPIIRAAATSLNKTADAIKVIQIFVKNGANINATNKYSNTALDKAISKSNFEMVAFLIKAGANVNQQDNNGNAPLKKVVLHYLNTEKYSDGIRKMIYLLLTSGAKVNTPDKNGRTALIAICMQIKDHNKDKAIDAARILIENGANATIKDKSNNSALDYANNKGNPELIALISGKKHIGRAGTWSTHLIGSSSDDEGLQLSSDRLGNVYLFAGYGAGFMFYKFSKSGQIQGKVEMKNGRGAVADADGNIYLLGITAGKINGTVQDRCPDGENMVHYITKKSSSRLDLWTTYLGAYRACKKTESNGLILAGDKGVFVHEAYFDKNNFIRMINSEGKAIMQHYYNGTLEIMKVDGEGNGMFKDKNISQISPANARLWRLNRFIFPSGWKDFYTAKNQNSYVIGQNSDSDPSRGIYVRKYGKWNQPEWAESKGLVMFASGAKDYARKVITDTEENVYILGETSGSMHSNENKGGTDFFLIKVNSKGERLWTLQFGSKGDDSARDIHITSDGAIVVTGSSKGDIGREDNNGGRDICIFKIDPQGALYTK